MYNVTLFGKRSTCAALRVTESDCARRTGHAFGGGHRRIFRLRRQYVRSRILVGGCAHILARTDGETQYAAIFPTIAASVLTCIIVGAILGAYTGHYDGLGLSKTMILGTIVGGSAGVLATLFSGITASVIIGALVGALFGLWLER